MNPILMAALISGGINALQGKRGSDLLKSTIRDTAIAYALGPASTGAEQTGSAGISNMANQAVAQQTAGQAGKMTVKQIGQEAVKTQAAQLSQTAAQQAAEELAREQITQPSFLEKTFSAIEKPFLKPGTQDISKFRVGLGAAALGGGAYAAGLFDPKKAPDPKYAGYNRFYAADPSMFDPLSPNYGPDVSKYPEGAPYSGLQEGGIADLENMQAPDDMMLAQQQTMDDGPGIVASLYERFREGLEDSPAAGMMNMNFQQNKMSDLMKETSMPSEINLPERIKKEFVLKFKSDPDKTAIEYAVTMGNKDRITITDVQKAKQVLEKLTNEVQLTPDEISNVMGIAPADGSNIRIPEPADEPEAIRQLVDTFRAKASNEPAQPQFQQGDLVDVLPSKYKKNENDESNRLV